MGALAQIDANRTERKMLNDEDTADVEVLVAPQWASAVSWNERKVYVDVSRDFVKNSPEWNTVAINRQYEARLHDYHGRAGFWVV